MTDDGPSAGGWRTLVHLLLALTAGLVVVVGDVFVPWTAWNLVPVVVAWLAFHRTRHRASRPAAAAFALGVAAVVAAGHLAWLFDWGGTATGGSTSALMFVILPVVALVVGGLAALAGGTISAPFLRGSK